jgi:hypothetical protein
MPLPDHKPALLCHPLTPAPMVRSVEAGVSRSADGCLVFFYRLCGDMARLLIPTPQTTTRNDGLWEHTCFEAFVAVAGNTAYREFNFSPSGQWAAYAFSGYRQPEASPVLTQPPQISILLTAGRLELTSVISGDILPLAPTAPELQIGLSAIIESTDTLEGCRSYWALRHPAARPDFHHRDSFVLEFPAAKRLI